MAYSPSLSVTMVLVFHDKLDKLEVIYLACSTVMLVVITIFVFMTGRRGGVQL